MMENVPLKPWRRAIFYHLLIWSVFIAYELLCIFTTVGLAANYTQYGIYYILYIGLFYFNAHVVLDLSFFRTRSPYLFATLFTLVEILIFGLFKATIDRLLAGGDGPWWTAELSNRGYILANIFRLIFFIGFSIAYWSMLYLTRFRHRAQRMEIEQLRQKADLLELENRYISVENAYLQNQVSPHLIFNSLNFIYYAVYQLSERAGKGIMLLSGLLRFSLTAGGVKQLVSLDEEVSQIRNLIELDRMRFKDQRYLLFKEARQGPGPQILPLVLLSLVENMVKHGECSLPEHPAIAELSLEADILRFKTVNKKREARPYPTTGLGLHNLRKRLTNTYPDRFELVIDDQAEIFTVTLKIIL